MCVTLEAIHLNHDPTSKTTGAFSIRRNERCDIVLPEWRRDLSLRPEDAPAAYSFNSVENINITIQAEFRCSDPTLTEVLVRACDGHRNSDEHCECNVLGTVGEGRVTFVNGEAKETLCLQNVAIREIGVGVNDVIWDWQYSEDGEDWEDITTSLHRIYSVVDMPKEPWEPQSRDSKNTQLPWTEVLDFACRAAASAKDLAVAATKVTVWANNLGKGILHYDDLGGWTGFTVDDPPRFDCSEFLLLLNGGQNLQKRRVDCDDCAAIVTSFSNVLGCELVEGEISGNFTFNLQPNRKIGLPAESNGSFSRHAVGWLGKPTPEAIVFDACVELDFYGARAATGPVWTVPADIVFHDYRPRLTLDAASAVPSGKLTLRRIGIAARHLPLEYLLTSNRINFDGVYIPRAILVWGTLLGRKLVEDLELIDFRFIDITSGQYLLQAFWQHRTNHDVSFNVDIYEVKPSESTAPIVENILARFHLRPQRDEQPALGSETYTSKGRFTIVFVNYPFVFLVRNTGSKPVSPEALAKVINELVTITRF